MTVRVKVTPLDRKDLTRRADFERAWAAEEAEAAAEVERQMQVFRHANSIADLPAVLSVLRLAMDVGDDIRYAPALAALTRIAAAIDPGAPMGCENVCA